MESWWRADAEELTQKGAVANMSRFPNTREFSPGTSVHWKDNVVAENNDWGSREPGHPGSGKQTLYLPPQDAVEQFAAFEWDWDNPDPSKVCAYTELIIGKKPWSQFRSDDRFPIPIDRVSPLVADVEVKHEGSGRYNLALDCWLTKNETSGPDDIAAEVMVWLFNHGGAMQPAGSRSPSTALDLFEVWHGHNSKWPIVSFVGYTKHTRDLWLGILIKDAVSRGLPDANFLASVSVGHEIVNGAGWSKFTEFVVR